jgi:hypothetical protein
VEKAVIPEGFTSDICSPGTRIKFALFPFHSSGYALSGLSRDVAKRTNTSQQNQLRSAVYRGGSL